MKGFLATVCVGAVVLGLSTVASAESKRITFTKDVLSILQENCQTCHRPSGGNMGGMIAPMSFMTYEETRPWAKAIARVVSDRQMPPWHASAAQNGIFRNERTLTAEEIQTITEWVQQRAPRGNPKDAPEPVIFAKDWFIGEPDLVIDFPEPFFVEDDVQDLYKNITVQLTADQLPEDKWVTSVEFKPGSEVVHHIIAYASSPDAEGYSGDEDAQGDQEFLRSRVMLGGLAPGTDPAYYPDGYALPLEKGSTITFAMHYHKERGPGTGVEDNSVMAMRFTDEKPEHEMRFTNMAHGAFEIPPNQADWYVVGAETFENDVELLNLFPHMHIRGKWSKYTAYYPDGTTEVLLETPEYDFNWQEYYHYKEPKLIPAGTRIEFEMKYDNSAENAERVGFNSNRAVHFGGPTTDEMDLGWYTYANADGSAPGAADD